MEEKKLTEAQKIWSEIKDTPIDLFGLKNQTVSLQSKPVFFDDVKLHLTINAGAVLPAIEAALGTKFKVDRVDKWVSVERAPKV